MLEAVILAAVVQVTGKLFNRWFWIGAVWFGVVVSICSFIPLWLLIVMISVGFMFGEKSGRYIERNDKKETRQ